METLKRYIKGIIRETLLHESEIPSMEQIDGGSGMETLYRVAFSDQLDSVFNFGYDRIYTGTKGGNMYGPGVYCTFNLRDSIENVKTKPEYGNCIMSMRLIDGFKNFIIFDENLAKKTYGQDWTIEAQISKIMGVDNNSINKVISDLRGEYYGQRNSFYNGRTAPAAHNLWRMFRKSLFTEHGVRGLIYKGNRDGHCALVYDFKSLIPYGVSFDQGRTFQKRLSNNLYNHIRDHADVEFKFGGKYDKLFQSVNGFTMVQKGQKFNIIDNSTEKPISEYWFDDVVGKIDPRSGRFGFIYNGIELVGTINPPSDIGINACILNPEGDPFCDFSDLPELINAMKQNQCTNFEQFFYIMEEQE